MCLRVCARGGVTFVFEPFLSGLLCVLVFEFLCLGAGIVVLIAFHSACGGDEGVSGRHVRVGLCGRLPHGCEGADRWCSPQHGSTIYVR